MNEGGYWGQRLSRRRVVKGMALGGAGLAAAAVIGCGDGEEEKAPKPAATAKPAAKQPKRGGTLRSGSSAGVGNLLHLDPQVDSPVYSVHLRLIYQSLLGYNVQTYDVEPLLAQKWEQPSQTEYIFTLQPGVKWHNKPPANGRELTVEDVVFSLERIRTNNPRFTSASLLKDIKIEAVDRARIKLSPPSPNAAFLNMISADPFQILAKDVLDRAGLAAEPAKIITPEVAVGTGPFVITKWEDKIGAEYTRNPNYWKPGLPYLDGLFTPYLRTYQEAYAAFQAGQLDVSIVPGQDVKSFLGRQGPGYTPLRAKEHGTIAFTAANTKVKPFDDARVTRALRLLHNHDEFKSAWAETFFGAGRYSSYLTPTLDHWDLPEEEFKKLIYWKQPKDDAVKEALSLLSAAGFTRDRPLKFPVMARATPPDAIALAQLMQAQWKQLTQGVVDVQLDLVEVGVYQSRRGQREYVYSMMTNTGGYVDVDALFFTMYRSGASRNYYNNSDPELDARFDKQRTLFGTAERKAFVLDTLRYMIDREPGITVSYHYYINAINPKLQGFSPEVQPQGQQYERLWLDT